LIAIHGIGRWSAEMFLMFTLGRPDVLPLDDYSLRKAYARAFGKRTLPSARTLERHGEKWRPYRTVASWYLWRTLEQK
ncbi:MAG: DNA-3-methyladenine glycosylase family protein, partial [Reyranellales bacterium]